MSPALPWEEFLRLHFPGYLLLDARLSELSEEAATRFLEGLGGRPGELAVLRAASLFAARAADLDAFARVQLPALLRALPQRAATERQSFEGRAPGRLDVPATLRSRLEGRSTRFTVHAPRLRADRPENALVKAVARRIVAIATILDRAGVAARTGWGASAATWARALTDALASPPLRAVADAPITAHHERCARAAAHPAYASAAALHRAMREGLEAKLSADPSYLAQGLQEAFLYRTEHAEHLRGWPAAILVASSPLPGEPRREDDVIAVGWDRWVPATVLDGLVEGLVAAPESAFR